MRPYLTGVPPAAATPPYGSMRGMARATNGKRAELLNRKWLYPGMHVKRWLLLLFVGITLGGLGLALYLRGLYDQGYRFPPSFYYITLQFWPRPVRAMIVGGIGITAIIVAIMRLQQSLLAALLPRPRTRDALANLIYAHRLARPGPRVVAIGGGHGLSTLLSGLKLHTSSITAIVNVADDGGSSGRLRRAYGVLPPGDIRRCLAALAETDESLMKQLWEYRFPSGEGLQGHTFGNLFLTALDDITGSFDAAIQAASDILAVRGRVLPPTLAEVTLAAELHAPVGAEGRTIEGESEIAKGGLPIGRVFLRPPNPPAYPEAVRAILEADMVVLGPGSLFTSVLPVLLVGDILRALRASRGLRVYVCNVATEPGETDNFGAGAHLQALLGHIGNDCVDIALVNKNLQPADNFAPEWQGRTAIVSPDVDGGAGMRLVTADVINTANPLRHDPAKLADQLMRLLGERDGRN